MKIRKPGNPFITENLYIGYSCSLTNEEAQMLIGKTIKSVKGQKHRIDLIFTDGTIFTVGGFGISSGEPDALDAAVTNKNIEI